MSLDETSAEFKAMKEEWQRRAADVASIDEAIEAAEYLHAIAIHAETQAQKEAKE